MRARIAWAFGCAAIAAAGCRGDAKTDATATASAATSAPSIASAANEERLDAALAEKLLRATWSARIGVGDANCKLELENLPASAGSTDPVWSTGADGDRLTLRGPAAARCTKSLEGAGLLGATSCKGADKAAECRGTFVAEKASVSCGAIDVSCRIVFACGKASMRDVSVEAAGAHATIRFRVTNQIDLPHFDGCPAPTPSSKDQMWTAKATLDGGHWALDGMPDTFPR